MAFLKGLRGLGEGLAVYEAVPLSVEMLTNHGMTAFQPDGIVGNLNTGAGGWHSDGNKLGSYFTIDLGLPKEIIKAEIYSSQSEASTMWTNAIFTINASDDGSSWYSASDQFSIDKQLVSETAWPSIGSHRYWRVFVTASKDSEGVNTSGQWIGALRLYQKSSPLLAYTDTGVVSVPYNAPSSGIMDTKIMGIPILYAGGGLLGALILMKILFRKK